MSSKLTILICLFLSQCNGLSYSNEVKKTVENEDGDNKSSLVFVFDTTGSMHNDLKQLREGAEMILNTALEENGIIGDFVFVPFHDPAVGPATVTRDKEVFKTALDLVEVYGGGDCPEKSLGGIQLALNVSESRSFVYVFTDATAGDHRLVGRVLDAVQRKQSQVVFVLTGHCNDLDKPSYKVYQQIAAASSGQVFNLNKTSVHKVLDFVRSSIKGRMVNLGSSVNPPGYNYSQGIPVDSTVGEVTVSVSGAQPQITVVNPSGEQVTGPPQLITTLDLSEIMVVKVIQPEVGNWSITVGSTEPHSVKVVGLSNVTFEHGFSVQPSSSMADTSYRPLEGTYNHMMISLTGTDKPVQVDYAEILTLSGQSLFEVPLKEVAHNLFKADAFIPPDDFFYIAINGRDEFNQELRRIGATAIQAKLPDVPYLSVSRKVTAHAHTRVVLKCKVESLVPVTAMWTKNMAKIQGQISSLQTTTIEYVIEDMTAEDVATYRCVANNVAGVSRAVTELVLIVDPPQVSVEPTSISLNKGENATISCTVSSEALLLKFQFISSTNESYDVIDVAVEPNIEGIYTHNLTVEEATEIDAGNYTCVASNRGGTSNKTAKISIKSKPIAQILGPHEISVKQNEMATIYCAVNNTNAISWAVNGSIVKEVTVNDSYVDVLEVNVTGDRDFMCIAKGRSDVASDLIHILVLIKPKVMIQGNKNITILNGTAHEFICQVEAKPEPRILWYRGVEETFLNHAITKLDDKTYNSILKLNSSEQDIEGTYYCVGENSLGIHEDSATVNVRRQMKILGGFNDTSVQLYSQVKLNCEIDAYPLPKTTWLHNSTIINSTTNIIIENNELVINRVDFNDLGEYSCEAVNAFERAEVKGNLAVFGLEIPVLFKEPAKKIVKEGDTTIFTCRVIKSSPEATLTWQYKNKTLDNFTTLHHTLNLTINKVTVHNAGVYRCMAENVMGRDLYEVELVVHSAPKLKSKKSEKKPKPMEIRSGERVVLSCEAVGTPTPFVLWSKDGRPMVYTKHAHLTDTNDLVIDKVTEYDSGLFTCNVTNPMGSVQKNFTLIVYVLPKISEPETSTEQEIIEGQLVELPCRATGVPSVTVTWQHYGDIVNDTSKYIDDYAIRFVANLTDFGDYTCIAENKYGKTNLSYSLYIWVPPYIEPPLEETKNILLGTNTSLQCDVVGFPLPTITWEFGDQTLKENTTDLSFNEMGNLYINNASLHHEGLYVCVAENLAGVARKIIHFKLQEPPKILEENYTGAYIATNKDSALTIACRVSGKPKPYVMWVKDEFYLHKDARYDVQTDGTLTIKNPSEDLSGNYTCIAKNVVGITNKTVEVLVYSLPTQMQSEESHSMVTVLEHTHTSVECPTRATHTDTVKWYKDATLISIGNLQISKVSREDQSTYACVVTNAVGSAYSAINLNVEWPPKFIDNNNDDDDVENTEEDFQNPKAIVKDNDNEIKNPLAVKKDNGISLDDSGTEKLDLKAEATETAYSVNATEIEDKTNIAKVQNDLEALVNNNNTRDKLPYIENKTTIGKKDKGAKVVEVVKGDDVYLDCSVDAKPIAKTKWLFNSKPIIFVNKDRLKIMNVQTYNSGTYKCVVGNPHGTIVKDFKLKVLELPFISEFDLMDVLLMEGTEATLDCNAKGFPEPTLRWTYNNTNWFPTNSSLTSTNITSQSEGTYRCDATNKAGATHIVYNVSVVSGGKVTDVVLFGGEEASGSSVGNIVEVAKGTHIRISCIAKGKPTPIVQWLRNGKLLSQNQEGISYADLKLDGADLSHNGAFTCIAVNEGGSDETKIKVEVLEPPTIFQNIVESDNSGNTINLEVLSGQTFYLHCHTNGNPSPEIYWFRDGLPLRLFDDSMVSTDFGEVIQVRQAVQEQSANYTCVARNKVGNTSIIYLVDVLVPPPQPKETSKPMTARVGAPLTLNCPVQGSPVPHVMWHRHPYTEVENNTRVILVDDGVKLVINKTQVSDSGNYSCIMTNKVGTTEVIFDVTIEKPPSIAGGIGVESHVVMLGKSVVLKCEVDGHPLPKITWLKDTQQLTTTSNVHRTLGDSLLSIWRVGTQDAGQYICVAESHVGVAHRRYHLVVSVPGKWSQWHEWSFCNVTCGLGYQMRSRSCQYIDDNNVTIDKSSKSDKLALDESACKGPTDEKRKCNMPPCEEVVPVGWSAWSRWSPCAVSCGAGSQARTRKCRNGQCIGDNVQEVVPVGWSAWSRWSPCAVSCGAGSQARTRKCRNGQCIGDNVQIRKCPGLPKCERNGIKTDDISNAIETFDNNVYSPEAVFEVQPEIVEPQYSTDVEEIYEDTGTKPPKWYDVEVVDNLDGTAHGACQPGYNFNVKNNTCYDIDECELINNQCHETQVCGNTRGGYRCSCAQGLTSLGPGQRCIDINECTQGISGCEYACVNVVGGYVCACPGHMRLADDKHTCYIPGLQRKLYSYEDNSEYLSASIEYPARYKHSRN